MLLDVRHLKLPVSDALHEFTRRRVERALRPFHETVSRVDVRTRDVDGPRGGVDIQCTVTVELTAVKQRVVVRSKSADAYAAVQGACARLNVAISRALGRQRRLDRFGVSPLGTSLQGTERAHEPERIVGGIATSDNEAHIIVTAMDHDRLLRLIQTWSDTRGRHAAELLADELERAEVVPAERITGSIVTMNSRVLFLDEETGEKREVSLVYPTDSDPDRGRISVLAPMGSALLGLSAGQTFDWPLPGGRQKRYRLAEVVYQPEEAGHRHL